MAACCISIQRPEIKKAVAKYCFSVQTVQVKPSPTRNGDNNFHMPGDNGPADVGTKRPFTEAFAEAISDGANALCQIPVSNHVVFLDVFGPNRVLEKLLPTYDLERLGLFPNPSLLPFRA